MEASEGRIGTHGAHVFKHIACLWKGLRTDGRELENTVNAQCGRVILVDVFTGPSLLIKKNGPMPKSNFSSMVAHHELVGLALAFGSIYKPLPHKGTKGICSKDASPQVSHPGSGCQPCRQGTMMLQGVVPSCTYEKQGFLGLELHLAYSRSSIIASWHTVTYLSVTGILELVCLALQTTGSRDRVSCAGGLGRQGLTPLKLLVVFVVRGNQGRQSS